MSNNPTKLLRTGDRWLSTTTLITAKTVNISWCTDRTVDCVMLVSMGEKAAIIIISIMT